MQEKWTYLAANVRYHISRHFIWMQKHILCVLRLCVLNTDGLTKSTVLTQSASAQSTVLIGVSLQTFIIYVSVIRSYVKWRRMVDVTMSKIECGGLRRTSDLQSYCQLSFHIIKKLFEIICHKKGAGRHRFTFAAI